eukprot:404330-Alexandrium_andersonii.AAC.1
MPPVRRRSSRHQQGGPGGGSNLMDQVATAATRGKPARGLPWGGRQPIAALPQSGPVILASLEGHH